MRKQQRHRRNLRRAGEECRHRRRRALIDVGRPHVERHGCDLERQADEHEHEPERQADVRRHFRDRRGGCNRGVARRARDAVEHRGAVEQHARRQCAEHEILEARFARSDVVALEGGDHIERQGLQLEAEIERDEVVRRDHHQHAEASRAA